MVSIRKGLMCAALLALLLGCAGAQAEVSLADAYVPEALDAAEAVLLTPENTPERVVELIAPQAVETEAPKESETSSGSAELIVPVVKNADEEETSAPSGGVELITPKPVESEEPVVQLITPKPMETDAPKETDEPKETESPEPQESDAPKPQETEPLVELITPKPAETDAPKETESPAPQETESAKPTETPAAEQITPAPAESPEVVPQQPTLTLASFAAKNILKAGSKGSISGSITCEAGKTVVVGLTKKGETLGITQECTAESPKFAFTGLEAGEYTLTLRYKDASSPALTLTQTIGEQQEDTRKAITITKVTPGENALRIEGTAEPLSAITLSTQPESTSVTVATDKDGKFDTTLTCAAKTYTAVVAQYGAETATKVEYHGSFVVTAPPETVYPTLRRGDRYNPLIYLLQQRLKDLGYYTIRVDGIYGSGTERAVRLFQQVNGLSATGTADNATQQRLYGAGAKPYWDQPVAGQTLYRSTAYQPAVIPLQRRLKTLGYYAGSLDGYFGSGTYRAVRNFQRINGLSITGVADPTTQARLYSASAIAYNGAAAPDVPDSTPSTGYRLLYWGCKGDAVRRLQRALLSAGYSQVRTADGIYGQWTYDAVRAFQKDHGLSVDGIAGRKTQNALYGTNY